MLNRTLRALFVLAFAWCALVEIAEFVAGFLFGMVLDGDWFLLLAGSSAAECAEFLRIHALLLASALAAFAASVAAAVWIARRASGRVFAAVVVLSMVCVAVRVAHVGALRAWKTMKEQLKETGYDLRPDGMAAESVYVIRTDLK